MWVRAWVFDCVFMCLGASVWECLVWTWVGSGWVVGWVGVGWRVRACGCAGARWRACVWLCARAGAARACVGCACRLAWARACGDAERGQGSHFQCACHSACLWSMSVRPPACQPFGLGPARAQLELEELVPLGVEAVRHHLRVGDGEGEPEGERHRIRQRGGLGRVGRGGPEWAGENGSGGMAGKLDEEARGGRRLHRRSRGSEKRKRQRQRQRGSQRQKAETATATWARTGTRGRAFPSAHLAARAAVVPGRRDHRLDPRPARGARHTQVPESVPSLDAP
jgi:hypothetical protein